MKKILTCALILSFSAASAGWLTNKIKSAATKVKTVAQKVHNSSAATKLRSKAKAGLKKAYNYASEKINGNFRLPYQIMSTVKKLRKATQTIENNYGGIAAATALIALCKECEANPIKVMRSISDISDYIGEMEKFTDEDGSRVIPEESTEQLLGYMRELNNLVYEYSLPYMNNIKKMLNEATSINASIDESAEDAEEDSAEYKKAKQIRTLTTKLAGIMDDCLKDTENLNDTNMNKIATILEKLQERGVNITTLYNCFANLQNLIQSMQTLTKFKETGEGLINSGQNALNSTQTAANAGFTNAVNAGNKALTQGIGSANKFVTKTMEEAAEGMDNALGAAQDIVDKGSNRLRDSVDDLSERIDDISAGVGGGSTNDSQQSSYDTDEDFADI